MKRKNNNMMKYVSIIIVLGLLINYTNAFSQTSKDFETADIKTYQQYQDKNWDLLIETGNQAIHQGIDFYYLRYRLGVAYYQKQNYIKALNHFEKAESFYAEDPILSEYIYYSRYFLNRKAEADQVAKSYPQMVKSKLPGKDNFISTINLESGYLFPNKETNNLLGQNGFYAEEEQFSKQQYYHGGISLNPASGIKLYLGGSHLSINKIKRAQFSFDQLTIQENLQNYTINQNEFYSSVSFQSKAIKITPAFHFIKVNYDLPLYELNDTEDDYLLSSQPISLSQYVSSLSLSGNFSSFTYDIYASYSNLNYANQAQFGLNLYYFPLGNLNFYTKTGVKLFHEWFETTDPLVNNSYNRVIFNQLIGFKVSKGFWCETSLTYGDLQNTNEGNAFVVYNLVDNIKLKADINLIFTLSKNLGFSIRYQVQQRDNPYMVYSDDTNVESYDILKYTYFTNNIIGGLTWKM